MYELGESGGDTVAMRRLAASGRQFTAVFLAVTGLGGCIQTSTYGTGETPEFAIFREMTGGLGRAPKQPIDYQPRAPLVMPPTNGTLPPPVATAEAATSNWPLDPDKTPKGSRYQDDTPLNDISSVEYRRLKPLAGKVGNANWYNPREYDQPQYDIVDKKQRHEFQAALDDANGLGQTGRRYLTDPPESYRQPAATAPTEFEDIKKKRGFFLTRWLTGG
jgi:hypothetical protein